MKIPSREQCFRYLREYKLPENIVKHSLKVNQIAVFLARRLKEKGVRIDVSAVDRASLLHDLDKIKTLKSHKHGIVTEEILGKKGYTSLGRLAKFHRFDYVLKLKTWEEKIINYADKRCVEDNIVTLKQRFDYLDRKYKIHKRKKSDLAKKLFLKLEGEIFHKLKLNPNKLKDYITPKKGIIFDLGGVYLSSTVSHRINAVARKFKIPSAKVRRAADAYFRLLQVNKIGDKEFFTSIINELNLNTNWRKFYSIWMSPYKKYSKINRKVYSLVKKLKKNGYKVAALSNTEPHISAYNYQRKLFHVFDSVVLSYEVKMRKPEQGIYKHALKLTGLKASEAIFIDDYEKYLIPARKLGMETILFKSAGQLKEELEQLNIKVN
jgi:putative hydrolase of the HAD superfamily